MSRMALALVAAVVVVGTTLTSSLTARAQNGTRIEYVRVTPYVVC